MPIHFSEEDRHLVLDFLNASEVVEVKSDLSEALMSVFEEHHIEWEWDNQALRGKGPVMVNNQDSRIYGLETCYALDDAAEIAFQTIESWEEDHWNDQENDYTLPPSQEDNEIQNARRVIKMLKQTINRGECDPSIERKWAKAFQSRD